MVRSMFTFLLTLLGLSAGSGYQCAVRREIAPCTCRLQEPKLNTIAVSCEDMSSFARIVEILHNRFPPEQDISLKLLNSKLPDLQELNFKQLGMSISNLNLNHDGLSYLDVRSFTGLEGVEYLSLADNSLTEIPYKALRKMPKLKTLDLGRSRIVEVLERDFLGLPTLYHVVLPGNMISRIEKNAFPSTIKRIHLARNHIRDLNSSLRALTKLDWMFINNNLLTNLEDQLPPEAPSLNIFHASQNQLRRLPQELSNYPVLDSLFLEHNEIESLDGIFKHSRRLRRVYLTYNKIHTLAEDEFFECELMDDIMLGHNHLQTINGAFRTLKKLRSLHLTHNNLKEFSIAEIRGLRNLKILDLSNNFIQRLDGGLGNQIEQDTKIEVLRLEFNELTSLDGALSRIRGIQKLYLNDNKITHISPQDLLGFDSLQFLNISSNHIKSLEDTAMTILPRLTDLIANHNYLTRLNLDVHGMPNLCRADFSSNLIQEIHEEFGTKSACRGMGMVNVILHENPIICDSEYQQVMNFFKLNATLLHANISGCPTTTTIVPTTTTTTTTTTMLLPPIIVTLIRSQPDQQDPIIYSPPKEFLENSVLTPPMLPEPNEDNQGVIEQPAVEPTTETIVEEPKYHNPIVLVKDEGYNITLVIPLENGVIKKGQSSDHYIKEEDTGILGQQNIPSTITNIEIVDINPLPKPQLFLSHQDNENESIPQPIPLSAPIEPAPAKPLPLSVDSINNQPNSMTIAQPEPLSLNVDENNNQPNFIPIAQPLPLAVNVDVHNNQPNAIPPIPQPLPLSVNFENNQPNVWPLPLSVNVENNQPNVIPIIQPLPLSVNVGKAQPNIIPIPQPLPLSVNVESSQPNVRPLPLSVNVENNQPSAIPSLQPLPLAANLDQQNAMPQPLNVVINSNEPNVMSIPQTLPSTVNADQPKTLLLPVVLSRKQSESELPNDAMPKMYIPTTVKHNTDRTVSAVKPIMRPLPLSVDLTPPVEEESIPIPILTPLLDPTSPEQVKLTETQPEPQPIVEQEPKTANVTEDRT